MLITLVEHGLAAAACSSDEELPGQIGCQSVIGTSIYKEAIQTYITAQP